VRRFLAAPLLHFVVLGAGLFAFERVWERASDEERVIRVSRATREHLEVELEAELGRAATEEEKRVALEKWKLDEAVYREAERSGILRTEPAVRARLAERARAVYRGLEIERAPTPAELEQFLAENRARYELPERFDFEHAFAARERGDTERRAREFKTAAEKGGELLGQGDEFPPGAQLGEQSFEEIARVFGFGFATGLAKATLGEIVILEGTRGVHAVRVTRRIAPALPARDELEPRLVRDLLSSRRDEAPAFERLLSRYRFVEQGS
jgi:hypothetical protein